MDNQTREQQVWQRVQASREEAPRNDLRQLQREAMELAAIYRAMASRLTISPISSSVPTASSSQFMRFRLFPAIFAAF